MPTWAFLGSPVPSYITTLVIIFYIHFYQVRHNQFPHDKVRNAMYRERIFNGIDEILWRTKLLHF